MLLPYFPSSPLISRRSFSSRGGRRGERSPALPSIERRPKAALVRFAASAAAAMSLNSFSRQGIFISHLRRRFWLFFLAAGGLVLFPPSSPAGSFSVAMVGLLLLLRNRSRCRNTGRGQTMRGIDRK